MIRVSFGRMALLVSLLFLGAVLWATTSLATPPLLEPFTPEPFPFSDRYPAEVMLRARQDVATLARLGIDVDGIRPVDETHLFPRPDAAFEPLIATVYINQEEAERLALEGLAATPIPNESLRAFRLYGPGSNAPNAWPTFAQFVTRMQALAAAHPDIVRMISIGQSVLGRDIWMLKISDNPDVEEDEPEVKYTSTVHGHEGVGTEMTIRLAELLANSYGTDPDLTALVDEMEIWLCPVHNPDGYVAGSRYNAHGVDLNRDFPDRITDPVDDPAGREPETQAFMYFGYDHRFVMGANYHTGARVVNYPWDSVVASNPDLAPDDALYYDYSVGYAVRNSMIWNGGFPNGVTRGWEWYIIRGGMQDWAYHWRGEHHVTIELSDSQPPPYEQMNTYWDANREAMLWWMQRALTGVRGLVTDAHTGAPLDATVDVLEIGKPVRTDPDVGDYHRLLLPGSYTLKCSADGYLDQAWAVEVVSGTATIQDCALLPESAYDASVADSEASGAPGETVTHTFTITNLGTVSDSYTVGLTPGVWPATLMEPQVGPLAPQAAGQIHVMVDIPQQPAVRSALTSDLFTLSVTSAGDPQVRAEVRGTTHAVAELSVALAAESSSLAALAGSFVTFTLAVTNTGGYTDTYTLSLTGQGWAALLVPTHTLSLGPDQSAKAWVLVEIPAGASGQTDTVTVTITSGWDAQIYAEERLVTMRAWGIYLPLIRK
jgi:hypothetical protein